jgi:hypothetical protein
VRRHAATIVVLSLLVGTAVAFAETERLKVAPTPIEEAFVQPAFSPVCSCATARAEIRIRLHRADTVTIRVLDQTGRMVDVVAEHKRLPRGRSELYWDGAGAPDGKYQVDVRLEHAGRTFKLPRLISLDTVAPTPQVVSVRSPVRAHQRVRVVYRVSEPAHAVLYVNGKRVILTHTKLRRAKLDWRPLRRGRYRLQLAAVDLAGNLGPRTSPFIVKVRSSA